MQSNVGVTNESVYPLRERKGQPAQNIGPLWKFQFSEVDEWVRAEVADDDDHKHK
ncbi:transcriptional regulator [Halomonas sp. QHL1]|uniref:transcriptional regulator n=1 Tax=Halomonas sp. QHL1 TaxID=1123773 RepID=UPI001C31C85F|nr:transcriptional regulator [Halomonas sp. QHL1]